MGIIEYESWDEWLPPDILSPFLADKHIFSEMFLLFSRHHNIEVMRPVLMKS